jgi:hypothetical protein
MLSFILFKISFEKENCHTVLIFSLIARDGVDLNFSYFNHCKIEVGIFMSLKDSLESVVTKKLFKETK